MLKVLYFRKIFIIFFFVFLTISCVNKGKKNLLSRNENGFEIPQDILIDTEEPSTSLPHYFKIANIDIILHDGEQKYVKDLFSDGHVTHKNKSFYHLDTKQPGVPIRIVSPDNVPNSEYKISFQAANNSLECKGVMFRLSNDSRYMIIKNFNSLPKETCFVLISVSTPDMLNQINRVVSVTWNKSYSNWVENSKLLNKNNCKFQLNKWC